MRGKKIRISDFSLLYKILTYIAFVSAIVGVGMIILRNVMEVNIVGSIWASAALIGLSVVLLIVIMSYALKKSYENV
jgi:hypothetical protein